jgi:hypothetical protein
LATKSNPKPQMILLALFLTQLGVTQLFLGCRQVKKDDDKEVALNESAKGQVRINRIPKRAGSDGDQVVAAATTGDGVRSAVDVKTGRLKTDLVLRLDYFPDAKPGQSTLPVCYAPFPESFELGRIECPSKAELSKTLFAKNVIQECYTKAAQAQGVPVRKKAGEWPMIPGCADVIVRLFAFDPPLRLDGEVRD